MQEFVAQAWEWAQIAVAAAVKTIVEVFGNLWTHAQPHAVHLWTQVQALMTNLWSEVQPHLAALWREVQPHLTNLINWLSQVKDKGRGSQSKTARKVVC